MAKIAKPESALLTLGESEMRELGYRIVDSIVEHQCRLRSKPVSRIASHAELRERLLEPVPMQGRDAVELLEFVEREVLANIMHTDHPRFFGFVPGPSNFVGAMADALAAGYNTIVTDWMEGSGPAMLELVTIDWLRQLCGMPEHAGGLFVSGGSMANLTALAVARQSKLGGDMSGAVVYSSGQTHASNKKALNILGFTAEQHRAVATDSAFRIDVDELAAMVGQDKANGRRPFCVIANAGTTNTGAVDPLPALTRLGRREDLWIHVDGAFGASVVIAERGKQWLEGLGDVDSLSIDPHKWLFQPFEIGCVLVRNRTLLRRTFAEQHVYMQDVETSDASQEINFSDYGPQLTRGFRALKLWLSLKTFGLSAFIEAVDHTLDLAEQAEVLLRSRPSIEVCTAARMGVVTFRYLLRGAEPGRVDALNLELVQALIRDGYAMLTSTRLDGRTVLRLCTINPRTTHEDLIGTLDVLDRLYAAELSRQGR